MKATSQATGGATFTATATSVSTSASLPSTRNAPWMLPRTTALPPRIIDDTRCTAATSTTTSSAFPYVEVTPMKVLDFSSRPTRWSQPHNTPATSGVAVAAAAASTATTPHAYQDALQAMQSNVRFVATSPAIATTVAAAATTTTTTTTTPLAVMKMEQSNLFVWTPLAPQPPPPPPPPPTQSPIQPTMLQDANLIAFQRNARNAMLFGAQKKIEDALHTKNAAALALLESRTRLREILNPRGVANASYWPSDIDVQHTLRRDGATRTDAEQKAADYATNDEGYGDDPPWGVSLAARDYTWDDAAAIRSVASTEGAAVRCYVRRYAEYFVRDEEEQEEVGVENDTRRTRKPPLFLNIPREAYVAAATDPRMVELATHFPRMKIEMAHIIVNYIRPVEGQAARGNDIPTITLRYVVATLREYEMRMVSILRNLERVDPNPPPREAMRHNRARFKISENTNEMAMVIKMIYARERNEIAARENNDPMQM